MAGNLVEATDADFEAITTGNEWVLVDFWAPWCGPCKMIAPVLDQIAAERENLTIAKVNTDVNPLTPGRFGVRGIPFLVLSTMANVSTKKLEPCRRLVLMNG